MRLYIRPKKKTFVCPFGPKIRRVGRSIFFFFNDLDAEEMQYHSWFKKKMQNWVSKKKKKKKKADLFFKKFFGLVGKGKQTFF